MEENARKLYMIFMTIGPKLNHKEGLERFIKLGKDSWIHKESKASKKMYSVYEGKGKYAYRILLGIGLLLLILNLTYFKNEGQFFKVYMWVVAILLVFISIFAIVMQSKVSKQTNAFIDKLSKGKRDVMIKDRQLINKTDTMTTTWDLDNLLFMVETLYGYILIFKNTEVSFVDIKGAENFDILNNTIKEYVSEEQYLPMFMQL